MEKSLFEIEESLSLPKYRQIVDGIITAIQQKELNRGDALPSVNKMCKRYSVARETVVKAYNELKSQGIIEAIPGKGFYVITEYTKHQSNIFLLFDSFSLYKQELYAALRDSLGDDAILDIYFHHFNIALFEKLLLDSVGKYTVYCVMPFTHKNMPDVFAKLDVEKLVNGDFSQLVILDRERQYAGPFSYIGQDFDTSVYHCLEEGLPLLSKYHRMVMVCPQRIQHPEETFQCFKRFCEAHIIEYAIIYHWGQETITSGTAYFVVDAQDLIYVIEQCNTYNYILGQDVGILSYNDTPIMRVLCGGITVISTDFIRLGKRAAEYIRFPQKTQEIIPTNLIVRKSL
jgi:DNA-binding transcriptional regulator YhcF (GntR family)